VISVKRLRRNNNANKFNELLKSKGADKIKEEYMLGKHSSLTNKQLEKVCRMGNGRGGCAFKYKKRVGDDNDTKK
jgi:hypothetical protein